METLVHTPEGQLKSARRKVRRKKRDAAGNLNFGYDQNYKPIIEGYINKECPDKLPTGNDTICIETLERRGSRRCFHAYKDTLETVEE